MSRLLLALVSTILSVAAASAAEGPVGRVLGFFRWSPPVPSAARAAVEGYRGGKLFEVITATASGLRAERSGAFRDDLLLLRGLALEELGWRREAAETFAALLELPEPSPYYPLALLELVECRHREGRFDAVVEAYARYAAKAWASPDRRWRRVRNLFEAYGELRDGSPTMTNDERELVMKPAAFSARLRERKDRPSERLLYLAGLDLFRQGRHRESLAALGRIGVVSFYHPYALYTSAQDLYALGDARQAAERIREVRGRPPGTSEETALGERAGIFFAQMLLEQGKLDEAVAEAAITGDGRYAIEARLLRAETVLSQGEPSLAITFYRDVGETDVGPELAAARGLGLGAAYTKLGDYPSATQSLEAAVAALRKARADLGDREAGRLRALAELRAATDVAAVALRRGRIADGLERAWALKGPLSIGKLARLAFVSHKNTVVGEPAYDLRLLTELERPSSLGSGASGDAWLEYLGHAERPKIEDLLASRSAVESESRPTEGAFRTLAGALRLLESGAPDPGAGDLAARVSGASAEFPAFTLAAGVPLPQQVASYRGRFLTASLPPAEKRAAIDPAAFVELRAEVSRGLDRAVDAELRQVLAVRDKQLRRIEFDLETELSRTAAAASRGIHAAGEVRN